MIDRPRYDVAGGKLATFVESIHEAVAVRQQQLAALSAHGFGNQKRARLWVVQAGGMELVELHVRHPAAGAPSHGDAVAGRAVGIAGIEIDLAGAAGGQHHEGRLEDFDGVRFHVVDVGADDAIGRCAELLGIDQIDCNATALDVDVRMCRSAANQCFGNGGTGGIRNMQDAALRVPAFAG